MGGGHITYEMRVTVTRMHHVRHRIGQGWVEAETWGWAALGYYGSGRDDVTGEILIFNTGQRRRE